MKMKKYSALFLASALLMSAPIAALAQNPDGSFDKSELQPYQQYTLVIDENGKNKYFKTEDQDLIQKELQRIEKVQKENGTWDPESGYSNWGTEDEELMEGGNDNGGKTDTKPETTPTKPEPKPETKPEPSTTKPEPKPEPSTTNPESSQEPKPETTPTKPETTPTKPEPKPETKPGTTEPGTTKPGSTTTEPGTENKDPEAGTTKPSNGGTSDKPGTDAGEINKPANNSGDGGAQPAKQEQSGGAKTNNNEAKNTNPAGSERPGDAKESVQQSGTNTSDVKTKTTNNSGSKTKTAAPKSNSVYVDEIAPAISEFAAENDLYASVMIAQSILATNHGKSKLKDVNNLFGISGSYKGKSVSLKTSGGSAKFASYSSTLEAMQHYQSVMKSKPGYKGAFKSVSSSAQEAVRSIAPTYAVDKKYADKIVSLIERYDLTKYDQVSSK